MRPESYECPKCGFEQKCRSGWKPYSGQERWKRRVRRCEECGSSETFVELPKHDLAIYMRASDARREAGSLVSGLGRVLKEARALARET